MRDSVQQCKMRDISCVEVSSSTRLGVSNFNQVYEDILNEKYRIVFCAPDDRDAGVPRLADAVVLDS